MIEFPLRSPPLSFFPSRKRSRRDRDRELTVVTGILDGRQDLLPDPRSHTMIERTACCARVTSRAFLSLSSLPPQCVRACVRACACARLRAFTSNYAAAIACGIPSLRTSSSRLGTRLTRLTRLLCPEPLWLASSFKKIENKRQLGGERGRARRGREGSSLPTLQDEGLHPREPR